ncbi:MAG: hypothetical protein Fur0018_14820 [Anaerolineales bacterium]
MKHGSRLILYLVLTLALLGTPWWTVRAQDGVRFDTLEVDLWPEYDQARTTLVIYRIDLPADIQRPASLTVRIPAAAGTPNAVAESQTPTDTLFNVQYTTRQDAQWVYVQFSASMPHIRIEYYDPALKVDGSQRSFTYRWPGDYPVDTLVLQVQQPRTASGMELTPALGQPAINPGDNLTYYTASFASLKAGESFELKVGYQKSDDTLSVEGLQVVPADNTPNSATAFAWRDALPWILGGLGVILIIGGAFWYWRGGQEPQPSRKRHHKSAKQRAAQSRSNDGQAVYCHQCGKRADAGDRFCRTCGAPLRRADS